MIHDSRFKQLSTWVSQYYPQASIEVASADASFRRYFRVYTNANSDTNTADNYQQPANSLIAMDAPPDKEDCAPFIDVTQRLLSAGVHAPQIYQQDLAQGFLLLEDLGGQDYLDHLTQDSADLMYIEAMQALVKIQQADTQGLPEYDADFLLQEMLYMPEWFLRTHLNIQPTPVQTQSIQQCFEHIVGKVLEQPQVFVHRDYHSRNLMLTDINNPGVIDYQDAMLGPITYDLVSLLRDCYIQWPNEQVEAWVLQFKKMLEREQLENEQQLPIIEPQTFIEWFDVMGLQRHIKVLGIFARLNHRDGKPNYLNDLPLTLHYTLQIAQKYPETQVLCDLFTQWEIPQRIAHATQQKTEQAGQH